MLYELSDEQAEHMRAVCSVHQASSQLARDIVQALEHPVTDVAPLCTCHIECGDVDEEDDNPHAICKGLR